MIKNLPKEAIAFTENFLNTNAKVLRIVAILMSLTVFLTLCIINITRSYMWFDEAFTAYLVRYDFGGILQYTANDVHPPLYYWILKVWITIFGGVFGTNGIGGELTFRSFSVVCGVLTIIASYFLVKSVSNWKKASLAVILLSFSPLFVRYALETRMYALFTLLAVLSTLVLVKITQILRPKLENTDFSKRKLYLLCGAYACLVSAGLWTQYLLALVYIAQFAWFCISTFKTPVIQWLKKYSPLFLAYIVAGISYLPWIPVFLAQYSAGLGGGWRDKIDFDSPIKFLTQFLFYQDPAHTSDLYVALFWLIIMAFIYSFWVFNHKKTKKFSIVSYVGFVPILLLCMFPIMAYNSPVRYMIASATFLVLLIALVARYNKSTVMLILGTILAFTVGQMTFYNAGDSDGGRNDYANAFSKVVNDAEADASSQAIIVGSNQMTFYTLAFYEDANAKAYYFEEDFDGVYGAQNMMRDSPDRKLDPEELQTGQIIWNLDIASSQGYINHNPDKFELLSEEIIDDCATTVRKYRVK